MLVFSIAACTTDQVGAASRASPGTQVQRAIDSGPRAVKRLVDISAGDYALASAILKKARASTTTTYGTVASHSRVSASIARRPTCKERPVESKTTIAIAGVALGWRKAIISWCWNGSTITSWEPGTVTDAWAGGPYCWRNESLTDRWIKRPTRRKVRNRGSLTVIGPLGCFGLQQTIAPSVHYYSNGDFRRYAND